MIEKLLMYIKHHFSVIWSLIDFANRTILNLFYRKKIKLVKKQYSELCNIGVFSFKLLTSDDVDSLKKLFLSMNKEYLKYFKPHKTDRKSLSKIINNKSFIPLGFFYKEELIGYFFLRLFCNKRAFIGRLVSEKYKGKGIAKKMAEILYQISDIIGFNVYSTISKNNIASLKSHASVREYTIIKKLPNDYLLIKFDNNEVAI